jgi:hypothetical protein
MPSLRSLLSVVIPGRTIDDVQLPPGCQHIFQVTCWTCQQQSYQETCCLTWIVPTGVTRATFELWGGGGSGGGGRCCGYGPPGGSGAYAKKAISVTAGGCYQMFIGAATDCSSGQCGCRGCTTWVVGTGLTNLCAEGGMSGCWFCTPTTCCQAVCTCGSAGPTATMTNSTITGFTLTVGSVSAGTIVEGMKLTGTGVAADTTILSGSALTWTVDRTQTVTTTTITGTSSLQALAYGGDTNMPGVRGCFWVSCLDNSCWNKHFVPYPAGLVNTCGGTASIGSRGSSFQDFEQCIAGSSIGYAYMASQYVPGLGGTTSHVTGGTCTCGIPGRPGLIRVTYT